MNINNPDSTSFQQFQSSLTSSEQAVENDGLSSSKGIPEKSEGKHSLGGTQNSADSDTAVEDAEIQEKQDTQDDDGSWNNQQSRKVGETSIGLGNVRTEAAITKDQIDSSELDIKFLNKYNLADSSLSTKDLATLKPDLPNLPKAKDVNTEQVINEIKGNPWLTNSFMTGTTLNLMEVVKIKMKQVYEEGNIGTGLLNVMGELGVAIGDLELQKQLMEAQKHQLLAVVSIFSWGLASAAGALRTASQLALEKAERMKEKAANPDPTSADAAAAAKPIGSKAVNVNQKSAPQISSTASSDKTLESSSETKATTNVEGRRGWFSTLKSILGIKGKIEADNESTISSEGKSIASAEGRGAFKPKQGKTALKAEQADIDNVNDTDPKSDAKKLARAETIEKTANMVLALGKRIYTKNTSAIGETAQNFIETHYKIITGEIDQETEIRKAEKQIVERSLESVANDMRDATQAIDSLLQAAERERHESSRAHFLGPS